MTNEEAAKILKNEYMCRIKINSCNISGKTCVGCECYEDKDTVTQAINYAVQALSKQSASCGQADYKAQVKILADVLDSCPLTEPCDWMWRPTGWCKDHCKDGQDSPDAECWLEYARVMAESKTESDHIADSDKMVDQFRDSTKKTDDVSISKQEVLTNIRKLCDGCYLMEHCGQCNPECRLRQAIDMIEESSSVPMIPKKPSENGESEMNSMDEWWKNYIRSRMSQDDRLE